MISKEAKDSIRARMGRAIGNAPSVGIKATSTVLVLPNMGADEAQRVLATRALAKPKTPPTRAAAAIQARMRAAVGIEAPASGSSPFRMVGTYHQLGSVTPERAAEILRERSGTPAPQFGTPQSLAEAALAGGRSTTRLVRLGLLGS